MVPNQPERAPSDVAVPPAAPVLPVSSSDCTVRPSVYHPPAAALCVSASATPLPVYPVPMSSRVRCHP